MLQLVKIIRNPPVRTQTYFLCRLQARDILPSDRFRLPPSYREYSTSIPSQYDHLKILEDIDHKPSQVFICQTCEKSFKSLKSLGQHHSDSEKCSGEYHVIPSSSDTIAMYDKVQTRSSNDVESVKTKRQKNIKHTCDFCSRSFDSSAKFTNHLPRCHPYKIAKNEAEMKGDEEKDVRFIRLSPPGTKLFKCQKCSMSYRRKGDLERHIAFDCGKKQKPEPKSFVCPQCGKSYCSKTNLERHQRTKGCGSNNSQLAAEESNLKKKLSIASNTVTSTVQIVEKSNADPKEKEPMKILSQPLENITLDERIAIDTSNAKKYSCVECGKRYAKRGYLVRVQSTCKRCIGLNPEETTLKILPLTKVNPVSADSHPASSEPTSSFDNIDVPSVTLSHPASSQPTSSFDNISVPSVTLVAEENQFTSTSSFDNISVPSMTQATEENQQNLYKKNQDILRAYFDMKVNLGHLEDAHRQFKDILGQAENAQNVKCVEIYNIFLRGFAREPFNVHTVQSMLEEMENEKISPNLSSYISMIMSFHQTDPHDDYYQLLLNNVLDKCEEEGLGIATALAKGDFMLSDKNVFVETLKKFGKAQQIQTVATDNSHTSELLKPLQYFGSKNIQSQVESVFVSEDLRALLKKQISHEKSHRVTIPSIVQHKHAEALRTFHNSLKKTWRKRIMESLEDLDIRSQQPIYSGGVSANLRQFLTVLPKEMLTEVIMARAEEMLTSEGFSQSTIMVMAILGDDVMMKYQDMLRTEEDSFDSFLQGISRYQDWYCQPQGSGVMTHREAVQTAMETSQIDTRMTSWPKSVRIAIGRELLRVMVDQILIDRDKYNNIVSGGNILKNGKIIPSEAQEVGDKSFFRVFRKRKGLHDVEELKPHPALADLFFLDSDCDYPEKPDLSFPPSDLPMVVPPLPWVSHHTGGYIIKRPELVRYPESSGSEEHEGLLNDLPQGGLDPVLDALNQLSSVAWRVNRPILDLAVNLFTREVEADESTYHKLDIPHHPNDIPESQRPKKPADLNDRAQNAEFQRQLTMYRMLMKETYSLWCTSLYRLSLAKYYEDEVLWFPHNIDFRGRCYPVPPLLNHMGSDLPRSLFVFARGKKLGENGLRWLKLHCINLTGNMKRDRVEDRLAFMENNMDKILDSAENPLDGQRWWMESDDPWQTLGACIEIKKALEHPEGPEEYVCHLPIHQDGSCNGLQHYAALGRDKLGAGAVNLVPASQPQDVYSEIAAIVDRKRAEDAEAGKEIAIVCEGHVKRKVVKQTVMTTVYGVTKYGAQLQIKKQLKDLEDFPQENIDEASKYLATLTFASLNEMFESSQTIQDWLTKCADVITKDSKSNVRWVTPLGFPVVQPYSKVINRKDWRQGLDLNLGTRSLDRTPVKVKVSSIKNRNGFPPNFIHSLDSSHMMLTSLFLWPRGITFASVHDCFWTHAQDVETMNA